MQTRSRRSQCRQIPSTALLLGSNWRALLLCLLGLIQPSLGHADPARIDTTIGFELLERSAHPPKAARGGEGGGAGAMTASIAMLNVTIHFSRALEPAEVADLETRGIRFHRLGNGQLANFDRFYPAFVSEAALSELSEDLRVEFIETGSPKQLESPLEVSVGEVQADLRHAAILGDDALVSNRGKGVVIADFDTGIDVFHPDFFFVDESLAPYEWIDMGGNGVFDAGIDRVDLNRDGIGQPSETLEWWITSPNPFRVDTRYNWAYHDANGNQTRDFGPTAGFSESDPTYGELVFMPIDNDGDTNFGPGDQLAALGGSKIRAVLDGEGVEYYRGTNLINVPADVEGHGTAVSGILVGQAADRGRLAVGIAPEAELVIVDSSVGRNGGSYNLLSALTWARAQGADVVLWEFGSWIGHFMDGSSAVEQVISQLSETQDTIHITPNGNLAASNRHARVTLDPTDSIVQTLGTPTSISPNTITFSVVWRSDITAINIEFRQAGAPTFISLPSLPARVQLDATYSVTVARSSSSRGTGRMDIVLTAASGSIDNTLDWEMRLRNDRTVPITVHLFASDDVTSWSGGVFWTSATSAATTVTWPATADSSINVGSYALNAPDTGMLSDFSGRGPRIDGLVDLLDLTAPGHSDIRTAAPVSVTGRWANYRENFGGTSAAAPHVAGAAALLLQAIPSPSVDEITAALRDSALADGFTGTTYNDDWGYGKLRIDDAYWLLANQLCPSVSTPANPSPASGTPGQSTDGTTLGWSASAPGQFYDIYFGDSSPPPLVAAGRTTPSHMTGPLAANRQYFWRIVSRNDCLDPLDLDDGGVSVTGPEWTFTTGVATESEIVVYDDFFTLVPDGGTVQLFAKPGPVREYSFRIGSTGTAPLNLINPTTPVFLNTIDPTFEIISQPSSPIAPATLQSFVLRVTPNAGQAASTSAFIPNDTPNGMAFSFSIELLAEAGIDLRQNGLSLPPSSEGSETVFQFPTTSVGNSDSVFFHIFPTGGAPLELIGNPIVALAGPHAADFAVTVQPSSTLLTAGNEAFIVEFTPSEGGARQATLSIETNAPSATTYTIDIVGVGVGCEPGVDFDCDGVVDEIDNCPLIFNPPQTDRDADGLGDECIVLEIGRYDPIVTAPAHIVGDAALVARGSAGVTLLDISDRTAPLELFTIDPGYASTARLLPDQRIVSTSPTTGVSVFDSANPASPVIDTLALSSAGLIRNVGDIGYLQAADFYALDLSAASGPAILDQLITPGSVRSVDIVGDRAYVGDTSGQLLIVDISNPTNLQVLGTFPTSAPVESVALKGSIAYVAVGVNGFVILDISTPASITQLGGADTEEAESVVIADDLLFVADDFFGHLKVFDVSNPAAPLFVAQIDNVEYPRAIERDADYLYVSDADWRIFDLYPDNDGDGLEDRTERTLGTGVLVTDSDGDGLDDGDEVLLYGTTPTLADTDGDGLDDATELFALGTNPLLVDTDADGVDDDIDNCALTPNGPLAGPNDQVDTDADGIGDVCDPTPIPEPGGGILLLAGILTLVVLAHRRRTTDLDRSWPRWETD